MERSRPPLYLAIAAIAAIAAILGFSARPATAQAPRLFYETDGTGVPVVFVPEWGHDTGSWFRILPPLREHGWRLVRYDLRGQGRSEAPADGDYSLEAEIEDLGRLLDGLGIGRAHLVGGGFGATIALGYARAHPERVLSVTAMNPRLGWSEESRAWWDRFLAAYGRVGRPTLGEYTSVLVERWLGTDFAYRNPWVVSWYDLMLRRQDAAALVASLRARLSEEPAFSGQPDTATPILIARGGRWREERGDEEIRHAFADARREVLEDSRAVPWIDAPKKTVEILQGFLESATP